jgi:hypothetical protein
MVFPPIPFGSRIRTCYTPSSLGVFTNSHHFRSSHYNKDNNISQYFCYNLNVAFPVGSQLIVNTNLKLDVTYQKKENLYKDLVPFRKYHIRFSDNNSLISYFKKVYLPII